MRKEVPPDVSTVWKRMWHSDIPPKLSHFAWRLLNNILPTKAELYKNQILALGGCHICSQSLEIIDHCFLDCTWVIPIWNNCRFSMLPSDGHDGSKVKDWLISLVHGTDVEMFAKGIIFLWELWKARNAKTFDADSSTPCNLRPKVDRLFQQYKDATMMPITRQQRGTRRVWQPPDEGAIKLNCDGSLLGDNVVGVGVIARDAGRAVLGEMAKSAGTCYSVKEVEA